MAGMELNDKWPLLDVLRNRGDREEWCEQAAEFIEGLLVENADLRAAIKHLGHNPVTFINRAKRRREREAK
jgi:hypothetical protein